MQAVTDSLEQVAQSVVHMRLFEVDATGQNCPNAQGKHAAAPEVEYDPTGQGRQAELFTWPGSGLNKPAAHRMNADEFAWQYAPAGHIV